MNSTLISQIITNLQTTPRLTPTFLHHQFASPSCFPHHQTTSRFLPLPLIIIIHHHQPNHPTTSPPLQPFQTIIFNPTIASPNFIIPHLHHQHHSSSSFFLTRHHNIIFSSSSSRFFSHTVIIIILPFPPVVIYN